MGKDTSQREMGIDLARGLCAVWVMYYHYRPSEFFRYGLFGVLLFFMISGYCMAPSLASSTSFGKFLKKRVVRLLPALLVCATISTAIEWALPLARPDRAHTAFDYFGSVVCLPLVELPCRALKLVNPGFYPHGLVDGAYWSLEIEVKFYIFIAILYFLGRKHRFIRLYSVLLPFLVIAQAYWAKKFSFYVYLPAFLAGFAIYEFRRGNRRDAMVAAVSTFVSSTILWSKNVNPSSMPLSKPMGINAFLICVVLLWLFSAPKINRLVEKAAKPRLSPMRGLLFLGLISYPLYLIHQDVGYVLIEQFGGPDQVVVTGLLVPAIAILVAWVVHKYFEFRLQRIFRKH